MILLNLWFAAALIAVTAGAISSIVAYSWILPKRHSAFLRTAVIRVRCSEGLESALYVGGAAYRASDRLKVCFSPMPLPPCCITIVLLPAHLSLRRGWHRPRIPRFVAERQPHLKHVLGLERNRVCEGSKIQRANPLA